MPSPSEIGQIRTPWTTVSPEWFCETDPQPAIQEGTLELKYRRVLGAFQWRFYLLIDETTDMGGGGRWHFRIPEGTDLAALVIQDVTKDDPVLAVAEKAYTITDPLLIFPGAATFRYETPIEALWGGEVGIEISELYFLAYFDPTTGGRASATSPFTWGPGDQLVATNAPEAFNR